MRTPLIAANWKMNTTPPEAAALVKHMLPELEPIKDVETLLCPPFISTVVVSELLRCTRVRLGAQNCYFEDKGAFTGEIAPNMLASFCQYVILGHSERRTLFGETNQIVNKKVKAVIKSGMKPILCVGESLAENEAGRTVEVVSSQLKQSLEGIDSPAGLVVAYEPIWAIGTGRAATGEQANATIKMIREVLDSILGSTAAQETRILYGGSANASNIEEFVSQPEIDGALVGGASLKAADFISIVVQTTSAKATR
jgi:triosephosphate isomerase (TIM)